MDNDPAKKNQGKDLKNRTSKNNSSILGLAWELGYLIAIPLVVLALGGRFLDEKFGTSPLFILTGVISAVVVSSYAIYKKVIDIIDGE